MIQTSTTPARSASVNSTITVEERSNRTTAATTSGGDGGSVTEKRTAVIDGNTPTSTTGRTPRGSKPRKSKSAPLRASSSHNLTPLVSKETRWSAAKDAAETGQYTRLREHVVETESQVKDETDMYFVKSGLHMNTLRSQLFQVVTEAAALGSIKQRHKPVEIVTNVKKENGDDDVQISSNETTLRRQLAQNATTVNLSEDDDATEFVNSYVSLQRARKQEQLKDAEEAMERLDQHSKLGAEWKTMQVELPTSQIPTFQQPITYMTGGRLRSVVIQAAAEGGNARQERLVLEGRFQIHQTCKCVYCKRPSPYQTQSYQKLRMRKGWTDDSLEVEEGIPMSPEIMPKRSVSFSSSPSRKHHLKHPTAKRQTLANILQRTTASGNKHAQQTQLDPNVPSLFKATSSSKYHVKAWKTRAANAKRESYATATSTSTTNGGEPNSASSPVPSPAAGAAALPGPPLPLGAWVSPRGLRKKKLTGFSSPSSMTTSQSELPTVDDLAASSPTTKWDETFLSPRSKQKQKLKLSLGNGDSTPTTKPAWAVAPLKRATTKDSKVRMKELEDSRHTPAWAAGVKLLGGRNSPSTGQQRRSPRRRPIDAMSMTEHSPFRSGNFNSSPMRKTTSFDGEIDEEALLMQELEGLALESPRRVTRKPELAAATPHLLRKVPLSDEDDDNEEEEYNDDDDDLDSDEDDFAY